MNALACLVSFALGAGLTVLIVAMREFQLGQPVPEAEEPEIRRAPDPEFVGYITRP